MNKELVAQVKTCFIHTFNEEPLLVFSPGRINIIGEHTDYNEGFVFPAAVNKGIYAAIQKTDAIVSTAWALDKSEKIEFNLDTIKPQKR